MAPMRALKPWQAWLAFVISVVATQVAGAGIIAAAVVGVMLSGGKVDDRTIPELAASPSILGLASLGVGVSLLVIALAAPALAKAPLRDALGLTRPHLAAVVAASIGVVGLGPLSSVLVHLMKRALPGLTFGVLDALDDLVLAHPLWLLWPVLALSPGVCEEMFFRGAFQRAFGRGALAVLLSGVAFAGFHLDPHHAVGVLPIGLYLAWIAARTSSTWVTIAAHVANNTAAIMAAKASAGQPRAEEPEIAPWWAVLFGLALVGASLLVIARTSRPAAPVPDKVDAG
jgi:membrane protease YdiL (CAAX protease family)